MSQFATITGTTATGGKIKISLYDPKGGERNIGGGASGLSQKEFDAYKRAQAAMAKLDEARARSILEAAGFEL